MLDSDCTRISPAMRLLYVFFSNFMPHAPNLLAHGKQGLDLAHVRPDRLPLSPMDQGFNPQADRWKNGMAVVKAPKHPRCGDA